MCIRHQGRQGKGEGMKKVVLIGGIGSGKSTVCGMFEDSGAGIVKLDDIGHDVLFMPAVKDALRDAFGTEILDSEGAVMRPTLAAAAFDTAEHTAALNAITHPAIMDECFRRIDELGAAHDVVVVEVTSGDMTREAFSWADAVVAVSAPEALRIERACARGEQSEADVRARIARQATDEQRESIADYVVENVSTLDDVRAAVAQAWSVLVR